MRRDEGIKRLSYFSEVLKVIAKKEKFANFDIVFIPNPFQSVIDKWVAAGGEVHELVEPVDSLHPTQVEQPTSYPGKTAYILPR